MYRPKKDNYNFKRNKFASKFKSEEEQHVPTICQNKFDILNTNDETTDVNDQTNNNETNDKKIEYKNSIQFNEIDNFDIKRKVSDSNTNDWSIFKKKQTKKNYINEDDESEKKELYIENNINSLVDLGNNLFLNTYWTVWKHDSDCNVWTEDSYKNIYTLNSIGSMWRFLNNFHLFDKVKYQFFVMRNKIKPIWEDNNNRHGGQCSIKFECFSRNGKIDCGTIAMVNICLLMMNETLIPYDNTDINGVSYTIKNKSILIKIWCKNYDNKINEKLPVSLINKLDSILKSNDKSNYRKVDSRVSIRYTKITPEYDSEKL